jgi:hypothetical protein
VHVAPRATQKPVARPTVAPTPSASPSDGPSPSPSPDPAVAVLIPALGENSGGDGGGIGGGSDLSGGSDSFVRPGAGDGGSGADPGSLGAPMSIDAILAGVMPTAIATTGGVTMLMAFMVFGKKRRDGEPTASDDILAASAARGTGLAPAPKMMPSTVMPGAAVAASAVQAAMAPIPEMDIVDGHMPRWRRPSLMEARKTDPLRTVSTNVRLTFDGDVGTAVDGMERRLIRYRLVSLLSEPDEVRGVEIGVLDEGDEVVLLEKRGTYWRILLPDGREGWIHKMTLGDVVIDSSTAGGTWTAADNGPMAGGFEDILRAYTEKRQQFGES